MYLFMKFKKTLPLSQNPHGLLWSDDGIHQMMTLDLHSFDSHLPSLPCGIGIALIN